MQDRATFHDFAAGPSEQTRNPLDVAIDGNAFLVVQTAAGERYTRDGGLQINNQGQLVTASGDPVLGTSGPIVFQPTDKRRSTSPPTATSRCVEGTGRTDSVRGKLRLVSFADAQKLVKEGGNLYSARPGRRRPARHHLAGRARASSRSRTSIPSHEMSRMIEITRTYTQISRCCSSSSDLHRTAIEKLADVPA